jgi:NodT family efflux transporter outer membrane factor (OMF) lipoprotein
MRPAIPSAAAFALFACCLSGCAVGPDFEKLELPGGAGYIAGPFSKSTARAPTTTGARQRFVPAAEIPPDWWALFRCRALNTLIEEAIAANPDLEAAEATLRAAIANARAQEAALFPTVTADFNPSRNKTPGTLSSSTASNAYLYSLYTAQASVSYTLDVFGGVRRSIEAQDALADNQLHQFRAAYLTLAGNVANAAVNEASLREQIEATEEIIRLQKETLRVLRLQVEKGQTAAIDAVAQETALAQSELALPPLRKQLAQIRNLLAVLIGNFPNNGPRETFHLRDLHLPRQLPVSLPSDLVRNRPDVQAAEATLHNASALVGVSIANRLPNLTIAANYGASSVAFDTLLAGSNRFWSVAGNAAQIIFDADALRQKQKAAEAAYDSAAASYRSTVLTAFQNVADSLRGIQFDAQALAAAAKAERSASDYLNITKKKLDLGAANSLLLLSAQQAYQQARIALIQAQAARLSDTIALFQALGGGWWGPKENAATPAKTPEKSRA